MPFLKQNQRNLFSIIFLIYLLFFPAKYINVYIGGCFVFSCIPLLLRLRGWRSFHVLFVVVFLCAVSFSALLGSLFLESSIIRNYTEIFRFIPVALLFFRYRDVKITVNDFFCILIVYSLADAAVSFLQITAPAMMSPITAVYGSEHHEETSLGLSRRALGLSSGPGQHGSMMIVLFCIFLSTLYWKRKAPFSYSLALVCTIFSIILAQSQSAFIAMCAVFVFALFVIFVKSPRKKNIVKMLLFIVAPACAFLIRYQDKLKYLFTLFSLGLKRHSYTARLDKTHDIFMAALRHPQFLLSGYGKDYFGQVSAAMDNEYVFLLLVYGPIPFLMVIGMYIYLLVTIFLRRTKTPYDSMLLFIIPAGMLLAWPTSFLLEPRTLLLLTMLFILRKNYVPAPAVPAGNGIIYHESAAAF